MTTLTVWKFDTPTGAGDAEHTLVALAEEGLVTIHDAATVSWPAGRKKPETSTLNSVGVAGAGAFGGAFWGLLFGLLFFVPLLGAAIGAAAGAFGGAMIDVGIDDDFIKSVRNKVTPGTSALFLMTSDAALDKIRDAFAATKPELIQTDLSDEQEAKLREVFADD